ncbi:hypothetical protein DVH05_010809 [Phytophthora capsici]|nr:hypothetical protein DVH05_010809 [Phytophthora capsici]
MVVPPTYSSFSMRVDAFHISRLTRKKAIISKFAGSMQLRCSVMINLHVENSRSTVFEVGGTSLASAE